MNSVRGRKPQVIDTNVPIVANRLQGESIQCANNCAQALVRLRAIGLLLLDNGGRILAEYRRHLSLAGQPGVGDAFIKWVHDNVGRVELVRLVVLTPMAAGSDEYVEFPNNPDLVGFDPSDRKFVAVAIGHGGNPPILNATDRDWWDYREALQEAGVTVQFLCPDHFHGPGM